MKMYSTSILSRSYLNSLSSADLISLADEYGIDIPEGLNRRFIIGELLETLDEINKEQFKDENLEVIEYNNINELLPASYNQTVITALLRNPAWVYVYWDIKESELQELHIKHIETSFILRVNFFSDDNIEKVSDFYDIVVDKDDRERYVFLSQNEYAFRIDLVVEQKNNKSKILAQSKQIIIPKTSSEISIIPSIEKKSPLLELSGLPELIKEHFFYYRQSFS